MPEIREIISFNYPPDVPPEERTVKNAELKGWTVHTPYEVSDEQLEQEANEKMLQDILSMADSDIKVPQIGKILKALIKSRR